jgi:hypothetical protein
MKTTKGCLVLFVVDHTRNRYTPKMGMQETIFCPRGKKGWWCPYAVPRYYYYDFVHGWLLSVAITNTITVLS